MKIQQLSEEDRPREKLMLKGKAALSDAELIAILIGSGSTEQSAVDLARSILQSVDYNLNELAKRSVKDLERFKGIGEAKAISIVSALELGRRRKETEQLRRPKITASADVYTLMQEHLLDLPHEEFWVILLNRANEVLRKLQMSSGGLSGTVADVRMIFKSALEHHAHALILVHNHPSGNRKPSEADLKLTKNLKEAGKILEVPVLDHVIFAEHSYFSFADEGIL